MTKTILITGSSSGFGKSSAEFLLEKGHTVIATMRAPEGRNQTTADELKAKGANIVEMDVASDESVDRAIQTALAVNGSIDVVVNNAGIGVVGLQEAYTPDDWKHLFEINVFGVQRVCRAILPHMRERGSGLLLQVSSLLGRICIPFYGPYNASKWALEALCENYRVELSRFGVDVAIIEPGGYATDFMDRLMPPGDQERSAGYGDFAHAPQSSLENFEKALEANPQQNPLDVSNAIVSVIETPAGERPFRTVVDKLGMGAPLIDYNEHLAKVTEGIYSAFGTQDLLKLKTQ